MTDFSRFVNRVQATSLGIDPMNPDADAATTSGSGPYPSYRGFAPRGRGRGRARGRATFYTPRGRGGGPAGRANMKLDLRPRKLLVKLGATDAEKVGAVKGWFEVCLRDCCEAFSRGLTGCLARWHRRLGIWRTARPDRAMANW